MLFFLLGELSLHFIWPFAISKSLPILKKMPLLALGSYSLLTAAYFSVRFKPMHKLLS